MSKTRISAALRRLVYERAHHSCEYCNLPESFDLPSHQIDHITSEKHKGKTTADNLALSCISCNLRKGSDIAAVDPLTQVLVFLYNPRIARWDEHFQNTHGEIVGLSPAGRATIELLQLNSLTRIAERKARLRLQSD